MRNPSPTLALAIVPPLLDYGLLLAFSIAIYGLRSSLGDSLQPLGFYLPFFLATSLAFTVCGFAVSLYDPERSLLSLSYVADFLRAYSLWGFFLIAIPFFIKVQYSRAIIILLLIFSFVILYVSRIIMVACAPRPLADTQEVRDAVSDVTKLLHVSSDPLTLLTRMRMARPNLVAKVAKRTIDAVGSLLALPLVLIATPFIAWSIVRDSRGPILIRQTRIGKEGVPFTMYKFRTMKTDTELYAQAPRQDADARVTNVGKVLRKYSLDELPQIWNVLKGDMSLVGPRPEMPFIVDNYEEWQKARLRVKPGITGLWQIFGRKDLPLEENLEYDLYYVFNQSFFLDCAILLQTIPHLIGTKGAY